MCGALPRSARLRIATGRTRHILQTEKRVRTRKTVQTVKMGRMEETALTAKTQQTAQIRQTSKTQQISCLRQTAGAATAGRHPARRAALHRRPIRTRHRRRKTRHKRTRTSRTRRKRPDHHRTRLHTAKTAPPARLKPQHTTPSHNNKDKTDCKTHHSLLHTAAQSPNQTNVAPGKCPAYEHPATNPPSSQIVTSLLSRATADGIFTVEALFLPASVINDRRRPRANPAPHDPHPGHCDVRGHRCRQTLEGARCTPRYWSPDHALTQTSPRRRSGERRQRRPPTNDTAGPSRPGIRRQPHDGHPKTVPKSAQCRPACR